MSSIAALSVSGVTIKDVDDVPEDMTGLGPIIVPMGDELITDFRIVFQSFGDTTSALFDILYVLNYRFYLAPIAAGRGYLGVLDELADKLALFFDALFAAGVLSGSEDTVPIGLSNYGSVLDPSENPFWGCDIAIQILEFGPND